jgi:hypothetical protein
MDVAIYASWGDNSSFAIDDLRVVGRDKTDSQCCDQAIFYANVCFERPVYRSILEDEVELLHCWLSASGLYPV